jgi:hypothetical protein
MRSPASCVLTMGGAHGAPAIADDRNLNRALRRPPRGRQRPKSRGVDAFVQFSVNERCRVIQYRRFSS